MWKTYRWIIASLTLSNLRVPPADVGLHHVVSYNRKRLAELASARYCCGRYTWIRELGCSSLITISVALCPETSLCFSVSMVTGQQVLAEFALTFYYCSFGKCGMIWAAFKILKRCLQYEKCLYDTKIGKNNYYYLLTTRKIENITGTLSYTFCTPLLNIVFNKPSVTWHM